MTSSDTISDVTSNLKRHSHQLTLGVETNKWSAASPLHCTHVAAELLLSSVHTSHLCPSLCRKCYGDSSVLRHGTNQNRPVINLVTWFKIQLFYTSSVRRFRQASCKRLELWDEDTSLPLRQKFGGTNLFVFRGLRLFHNFHSIFILVSRNI